MADDDESLDEILSAPVTTEPETTEVEKPSEPVRDEHGRFAPKSGDGEPNEPIEGEPGDEPPPETEHNAPVAAVIAERRKAQAANERAEKLERDLAEMRGQMSVLMQRGNQPAPAPQPEPVKPPDFWEAPDKYVEHALTPFQQQQAEMTFRLSRAEAFAEFGKETVSAAEAAMRQALESGQLDPATIKATLSKSRDPVGDVVRWHQSSPAVQEATLRDKIKAELMAELGIDPNKQPAPSPSPRDAPPLVKMPPSLTKIPAGHAAPERDESLDEVLSEPRRRAPSGR